MACTSPYHTVHPFIPVCSGVWALMWLLTSPSTCRQQSQYASCMLHVVDVQNWGTKRMQTAAANVHIQHGYTRDHQAIMPHIAGL